MSKLAAFFSCLRSSLPWEDKCTFGCLGGVIDRHLQNIRLASRSFYEVEDLASRLESKQKEGSWQLWKIVTVSHNFFVVGGDVDVEKVKGRVEERAMSFGKGRHTGQILASCS